MAVRRFYLELVRHRRGGGGPAAALLLRAAAQDALARMRALAAPRALRVAVLVELPAPPDVVDAVVAAVHALARVDVGLDVWPQLADDDGRYLSTRTAARYREALIDVVDALPPGAGLALDVEPRARMLRAAWRARRGVVAALGEAPVLVDEAVRNVVAAGAGARAMRALVADARARGRAIHVAVAPPLSPVGWDAFAALVLGCPRTASPTNDVVEAAMCYAPMLDARRGRSPLERRAFGAWARRHRRHSAAIVLGPLSTGVLDDEPVYERLDDLVEDVDVAAALGFEDIACFSLEGLWYGRDGYPTADGAPSRAGWIDWASALLTR